MKIFSRIALLSFFLISVTQNAQAAAPTPTPSPSPTPFETALKGKWITKYSTSPHQSGDERKRSSITSQISVALSTSSDFWIQGDIGFTQILDPTASFNLVNPSFRGFYRLTSEKLKTFKIEIGPTTSFALSEETRRQSLFFTLGAAARIGLYFQKQDEGGFQMYYDIGFNRNVHQYEEAPNGQINTEYTLDHYLYAEYDFVGPFLIDAWVGFSSAWSYQNRLSNAFTIGQELVFSVTEWLDLGIAHERGGDFLSPSGQTYNFGLFDTNESRYSGSVTFYF